MPTNEVLIPAFIVAIILFAIARQVLPRKVRRVTFIIFPILALFEAYKNLPFPTIPMNQLLECLLTVAVGITMGAVQAKFTKVFFRNGQLYTQGGWQTVAVWITLAALRVIIELMFGGQNAFSSFSQFQWIMWFGIAAVFGTRSFVLYISHPEIRDVFMNDRENRRVNRER